MFHLIAQGKILKSSKNLNKIKELQKGLKEKGLKTRIGVNL